MSRGFGNFFNFLLGSYYSVPARRTFILLPIAEHGGGAARS